MFSQRKRNRNISQKLYRLRTKRSRRIYQSDLFLKLFFAKFNGLKSVTIVNKPQNEIEVQLQVVLLLALNNCSFFRGWPIWWSFLQRPMERSQYFEAWQIVPVTFIGGGKSFFSVFYITVRFVNKVHCPVSLSHCPLICCDSEVKTAPKFCKEQRKLQDLLFIHSPNKSCSDTD